MSDPIGTVRGNASITWTLIPDPTGRPRWVCMRADDRGMVGQQVVLGEGGWVMPLPVISAIPGTPAAEADPVALSRDELVDVAWQALPGQIGYRTLAEAVVNRLADHGVLRLAPTRESAR